MSKTILVPLDGSELARAVLGPVGLLASAFGADVEAVRVLSADEVEAALLQGIDIFEDVKQELLRALEPLDALALVTRSETLEGDAAKRLLAYADEIEPALIALSTHGRTGAERFARGSVAERIIRGARHPIFVANPRGLGVYGVARILVPLDGSARSERMAPLARAWANGLGAEAILCHALDEASPFATLADAEAYLARVAAALGGRTRVIARKGSASYAILATAREEQVDLIALATHGRTGAERLLFGSVAEHVLAHAKAPLLVLRTARAPEPAPQPL